MAENFFLVLSSFFGMVEGFVLYWFFVEVFGLKLFEGLVYVFYIFGLIGVFKGVMVMYIVVFVFVDWVCDIFVLWLEDMFIFIVFFYFDLFIFDIFGGLSVGCMFLFFILLEFKNFLFFSSYIVEYGVIIIYVIFIFF